MKKRKEPIKSLKVWVIIIFIFLLSIPWYLPTGSTGPFICGLPYWVVIVIGASLLMSAYLTYVLKYEWQLEEEEETNVKGDQ